MIRPNVRGKEQVIVKRGVWLGLVVLGATWLTLACSSRPSVSAREVADANDTGRTVTPSSEGDRALLQTVPSMASGAPRRVNDMTVIAGAPYSAASGRTCRAIKVTSGASKQAAERLTCNDGQRWFFVPDVFAGLGSGQ